tara:strand:- start:1619 stop:2014 length:396 start_codon:yes stop_codon:yes gene_type:complete
MLFGFTFYFGSFFQGSRQVREYIKKIFLDMKSIKTYNAFRTHLNEEEKWAQDVKVKQGKMTKMLDIPEGKTVTDVYEGDPTKLAKDLFKACKGDKQECNGMLAFAGNVSSKKPNLFTKAQQELEKIDGDKK